MKAQKTLNILLIVLIILLLSLISFVGIFYQEKGAMVNIMPDYILGNNLKGYRNITLEVLDDTQEINTKTESTDNEESNNIKEETTSNNEEDKKKSKEDYIKSANIIKARLKSLKVEDYKVAVDENTGKMEISIPEDDKTDMILSDLSQKGNFQAVDTVTGEVLLTNADIKSANAGISEQYGYSVIVLDINFNNKGAKKFKDITANYQNEVIESESSTAENETSSNEIENTTSEESTTNETDGSSTETEEVKTKQVTLKIDDSELLTTYFSEIVDNGVLQLTLGSSTDSDEIESNLAGAKNIKAIVENEALPIEYQVTGNAFIKADAITNKVKVILYGELLIVIISSLYMTIKYKVKGALASILSIGYIAILLIVIRLANVALSVEGILGIGLAFIMNLIFNLKLLKGLNAKELNKEEKVKIFDKTIKEYALSMVPLAILSVIFCFVNWNDLYSFGMVMFWSMLINLLYNLTFTNVSMRNSK